MTGKVIELNRNDLYEQVWKEPMTHLAKKYGISDVGLRKICRKLNVPTPPIGYWAKLQFGKKVVHPPLPKLKYGEKETYTLHVQPDSKKYLEIDPKIKEFIEKVEKAAPVSVAERLINPHPLVKLTRELLLNEKPGPGSRGVVRSWHEKALDIRVTHGSLKRALRIMDAVIKSFE